MSQESLLALCRKGSQEGWKQLFDGYAGAVYRWALYFGLNESGAADVTQEVFVTALKRIGQCTADEKISPWLFQITRRHTANHRRNVWIKKMLSFEAAELEQSPANLDLALDAEKSNLALDVINTLKKLPVKQAGALILHYLEGKSLEELAEYLDIPPGTAASRLHNARQSFIALWRGDS
jgi:RNA polymerase sigma-70 factor (ECF subfamily)